MTPYDILLVSAAAAYAAEMLFIGVGIARASKTNRNPESLTPTVSVVVAARNEEEFIAGCLTSIATADYPPEKLEIIAVNDHSTDKTGEVIRALRSHFPNIRLVETGVESTNLKGKTNAVTAGINAATGEFILFTDADCHVPPTWIRETVRAFTDEVGIVGGFTKLQALSLFGGMQSIDWVFLFGTASATAGWNIPLTAIGNNLSIRRSAYDATGGFETIPFSVTEDYALVQAVLTRTKYRLAFPLSTETVVTSNPCSSWRQLFRQKQRWGVGGLDMVMEGMLIMAPTWAFKLILLVGLFMASPLVLLGAFAAKCATELAFLWRPLGHLGTRSYLKYFPAFAIYYFVYVLAIPILALVSKRVVWKERSL